MKRVLLTGFEPFLQWTVNSSAEVVKAIEAEPPDGIELRTKVLPVVFAEAGGLLRREIDTFRPTVVLMLDLGGGEALRHCVLEKIDAGVGFIHLPPLPALAAEAPGREPAPSMALETQVRGVRLALELLVDETRESRS